MDSSQHKPLGGIGRKSKSSHLEAPSSPIAHVPELEPPKEETVEERADRRRAELKVELEKKAAKGPVKKKRRL